MKLEKIAYSELDSRQKEAYNFQKLSGVLADYGIITIKLTADWQGADLVAQHCKTLEFIPIQLKGRFTLAEKYSGKNLWIAFRDGDDWYLYDHDRVLNDMREEGHKLFFTHSWLVSKGYDFPSLTKGLRSILEPYRLV